MTIKHELRSQHNIGRTFSSAYLFLDTLFDNKGFFPCLSQSNSDDNLMLQNIVLKARFELQLG